MKETWVELPGYEGRYAVSDAGQVRSLSRTLSCCGPCKGSYARQKSGRVLRPGVASSGYPSVVLGSRNTQNVHVLVALAFIGPCPAGCEVRHVDGDRRNSRADNLCYGTRKENIEDSRKHGTFARRYEKCRKVKRPMRELICRLYSSSGFTQKELAALFSTCPVNVMKILRCGV